MKKLISCTLILLALCILPSHAGDPIPGWDVTITQHFLSHNSGGVDELALIMGYTLPVGASGELLIVMDGTLCEFPITVHGPSGFIVRSYKSPGDFTHSSGMYVLDARLFTPAPLSQEAAVHTVDIFHP